MINIENTDTMVSVSLRDWEEKVRDQKSLEIISALIQTERYLNLNTVKIICGLQIEEPEEQFEFPEDPDEIPLPCMDEPEEDPHILIPDSIPHSENTPDALQEGDSVPGNRRRKIDRGKVMALHNAGWSNVKIAEEMGCSSWSVSMIIKEEDQK